MKKYKVVLFIIGILFTSTIYAQSKIRIGVNSGATLSKFRGTNSMENSVAKFDFLFGVSFEYYLKNDLSLNTNLNYERKSFYDIFYEQPIFGAPSIKTKMAVPFNYLSLPILIKYVFGVTKEHFVYGGPYLGFLLNPKYRPGGYPERFTIPIKKLDTGLSFGIGKRFDLNGKNSLNIELRDNLGLINIVAVEDFWTIRTNSLNLILTWDFEI